MLYSIYNWALALAAHRYAVFALFIISFLESSFFPIPPDVILIPMIIAAREKAWWIAFVCTLASVLGGIAGYYVGVYFFEEIGRPVLEFYDYGLKFGHFQAKYNEWGAWVVFMAGVTPFPYKVITILSGVTGLNLPVFIFASILARGLRFFVLAGLLWKYGASIENFIKRRLGILFTLFCILLLGGVIVVKYLL